MTDKNAYTLEFETGTTREQMINRMNEVSNHMALANKWTPKQKEAYLSYLLSKIETATVVCDACKKPINIEPNKKYNYSCILCSTNFDLCLSCQTDEANYNCPDGFGCAEDEYNYKSKDNTKRIFVPNVEKEPLESYRVFNKKYYIPNETKLDVDTKKVIDDFNSSDHYDLSMVYFKTKDTVNFDLFRKLWLYFRSTNEKSIERYGLPTAKINYLDSYKIMQLYDTLEGSFNTFIDIDSEIDPDSILMLRIVYPNGDEFVVKKLDTEDRNKYGGIRFVTFFVPFSQILSRDNNSNSNLNEKLKTRLESTTGMTVDELNKDGQIFSVRIATNGKV